MISFWLFSPFAFDYWNHKGFGELELGKSDDEQAQESYEPVHCHLCGEWPCISAQPPRL